MDTTLTVTGNEARPASLLAAVIDATADAVIETDPGGLITGVNRAAVDVLGFSVDALCGQHISVLIPADCRQADEEMCACLSRGQATTPIRTRYQRADGLPFNVEVRALAVEAPEGDIAGVLRLLRHPGRSVVGRGEFDRLARLYAALNQVKRSIAQSQSRDDLLEALCRVLVEEGGFYTAWVGLHDEDSARLLPHACCGGATDFVREIEIYGDDRPGGQGPAGRAFRSQLPVICHDIEADPSTLQWREQSRQHGLRSVADFPIMAGGKCVGLLLVYSQEREYFQAQEVGLLFETAGEIGFALDAMEREAARRSAEAKAQAEQAFVAATMNAMPGIVYVYDPEGRFVRWNDNFEEVSGYSAAQIAQMHPLDFFPEREKSRVAERIAAVFDTGEASVEADFLTRMGAEIKHYFTGRRVQMSGREYLVGVGVDITEKQLAEQQRVVSQRRYRTLFEYAPDGILVGGREAFVDANESICRMLGVAREDIIGYTTFDLVAASDQERVKSALAEFDTHDRYYGKWEIQRRDGSTFPAEVLAAGLPDGDVIAMVRDISEQEAAAKALQELNRTLELRVETRTAELASALRRAETADRLKSSFLATMSHELRTPLNSIIGFTGILLQELAGPLNDEQTKQLQMVRGSARHLLDLINDVLDISKIEAGQLKVMRESFSVVESIERAVASVKPMADRKSLRLEVCVGEVPEQLTADRRRVEQVLINLLSNAVKFTDTGSVTLEASLEGSTPGGDDAAASCSMLCFRVTDTGIGITQENLKSLFQPFRQLDDGLARQHEGTGLGLAICRRLAELMQGSVDAVSTPGQGSAFTLKLPL